MLAVSVMGADDVPGVVMVERTTGKVVDSLSFPQTKGIVSNVRFAPDGKTLIVAVNGGLHFWKPGDAASQPMDVVALLPQMMVNDGRTLLVSNGTDESITRVDLQSGKRLAPLEFGNAVAGGFVPGKPLFWSASFINGIRLWDTRDWREILTTYHFDGRKFLAVTPEGIYDTNLGPDTQQFRWIVPDAPFQSLAPQTFMRDYFEPQLNRRRIDCTIARNCADAFKALPPIAALNRVLPGVTILGVVPDATGAKATVTVRVVETVDPEAKNGKTRSGIYAVRLFRNNRLVAQSPALGYRGPEPERSEATSNNSVETWRSLNQVRGVDNNPNMTFVVDLPTAPGNELAEFSAYAFNEDRVKSDTARLTYRQPVTAQPRPRRAFVITIGIDAYDEPRLALHFAASDAKLIAARLRAIQGFTDVRTITLTGERSADGKVTRVTRKSIQLLLSALGAGDPEAAKTAFVELGLDASQLDQTTPDDIVIFSFSGHGWADKTGNFYLVPSDGAWRSSDATPDKATLISAAELTRAFTALRAGEVALIIDACHSGASVDTGGFKPGPMGDAGLGQLAFDKGLRILAASQASDVAFEDPVLQQGLLTYALAREGITPEFGKADENGDGRIVLDEWLRYAVARLPSLSEESRSGRVAAAAGTSRPGGSRDLDLLDAAPVAQAKPQEPALFDFTGVASPIVLRGRQP
jgi:WD40 repeat protein